MGVRVYRPSLGRLTSVDPLYGGNATACDYCVADSQNCTDLNGLVSFRLKKKSVGYLFPTGITFDFKIRCKLGNTETRLLIGIGYGYMVFAGVVLGIIAAVGSTPGIVLAIFGAAIVGTYFAVIYAVEKVYEDSCRKQGVWIEFGVSRKPRKGPDLRAFLSVGCN